MALIFATWLFHREGQVAKDHKEQRARKVQGLVVVALKSVFGYENLSLPNIYISDCLQKL